MRTFEDFSEEENNHLQSVAEDVRKNQREVIEIAAQRYNVNQVDFSKSIATIYKGQLLLSLVYGHSNLHFAKSIPVLEEEATNLIEQAERLIQDNLRDSVERLRNLTPKNSG